MILNMVDINADFTIELPEEAANASDFSLPGTFGDEEWTREDVPLPEDVELDFAMEGMAQAYSAFALEDVVDFMTSQLESNGWVLDEEPFTTEDSYYGYFSKGDESLTLMIDFEEEGRTSIFISID
jgi:hypothetical protein